MGDTTKDRRSGVVDVGLISGFEERNPNASEIKSEIDFFRRILFLGLVCGREGVGWRMKGGISWCCSNARGKTRMGCYR